MSNQILEPASNEIYRNPKHFAVRICLGPKVSYTVLLMKAYCSHIVYVDI